MGLFSKQDRPSKQLEFEDPPESSESTNYEKQFGEMHVTDLDDDEEEMSDSERAIISNMEELNNHTWKPVDSLVVSLGKNPSPLRSAVKKPDSALSKNAKREVAFTSVIIREYSMILGDNPSCSYGPPVCLDWEYVEVKRLDLDEYEGSRKRRNMRQMVLSYYKRCDILEKAGYNKSQMKSATREINKSKRQRETTKFFAPVMSVESVVRSAGRKVKRGVVGKKA